MFEAVLKFLSLKKPPAAAKRPLALETVYASNKKIEPAFLNTECLDKQKEILRHQAQYKDAIIQFATLEENTVLIGLTKHEQPILRGIFMYTLDIQETEEWEVMKHEAALIQAGIAIFKPTKAVDCLKVIKNTKSVRYLIDHCAMTSVKSVWRA